MRQEGSFVKANEREKAVFAFLGRFLLGPRAFFGPTVHARNFTSTGWYPGSYSLSLQFADLPQRSRSISVWPCHCSWFRKITQWALLWVGFKINCRPESPRFCPPDNADLQGDDQVIRWDGKYVAVQKSLWMPRKIDYALVISFSSTAPLIFLGGISFGRGCPLVSGIKTIKRMTLIAHNIDIIRYGAPRRGIA